MAKVNESMIKIGAVDRRRFMQTSIAIAGAALPLTHALSAKPATAGDSGWQLQRFVYDDRFSDAAEAARHAVERGIEATAFSGDLTRLWYDDLDLKWRRAPMTLAGATTQQGLFVLETLAADRGMRVVYKAEHGQRVPHTGAAEPTTLLSWVIAPRAFAA